MKYYKRNKNKGLNKRINKFELREKININNINKG